MQYAHAIELEVRDYECDMQAVVNNGVYQNYLEHARHEFLKSRGIDFAALTASGINLVVTRAELDYRNSLVGGDRFRVSSLVKRASRVRFEFHHVSPIGTVDHFVERIAVLVLDLFEEHHVKLIERAAVLFDRRSALR